MTGSQPDPLRPAWSVLVAGKPVRVGTLGTITFVPAADLTERQRLALSDAAMGRGSGSNPGRSVHELAAALALVVQSWTLPLPPPVAWHDDELLLSLDADDYADLVEVVSLALVGYRDALGMWTPQQDAALDAAYAAAPVDAQHAPEVLVVSKADAPAVAAAVQLLTPDTVAAVEQVITAQLVPLLAPLLKRLDALEQTIPGDGGPLTAPASRDPKGPRP